MNATSDMTQPEFEMLILENFTRNIDFRFQYLFSINIACLMLKIGQVIQFNPEIGPLLKIV